MVRILKWVDQWDSSVLEIGDIARCHGQAMCDRGGRDLAFFDWHGKSGAVDSDSISWKHPLAGQSSNQSTKPVFSRDSIRRKRGRAGACGRGGIDRTGAHPKKFISMIYLSWL
jgi:hypothetical protein